MFNCKSFSIIQKNCRSYIIICSPGSRTVITFTILQLSNTIWHKEAANEFNTAVSTIIYCQLNIKLCRSNVAKWIRRSIQVLTRSLSLSSSTVRHEILFDHLMFRYGASVIGVSKPGNGGLIVWNMAPVK